MLSTSTLRLARFSLAAALIGAASSMALCVAANAQVSISVTIDVPPPPLPIYAQPPLPELGYIWLPGYWAWDPTESDHYWVPGTWALPPETGLLWTPGYWGWNGARYVFFDGYWDHAVGYYGGISYGFGYDGEGYQGGRWDHGVFFYNETVNDFGAVHVQNVYRQAIVVNAPATRVSFNGGDGGTRATPSPEQIAERQARHVAPTPAQQRQIEQARQDKTLFAKSNHGVPPIAATAKPGDFKGAGVVAATEAGKAAPRAEDLKPAAEPRKPAADEINPAEDRKPNAAERKPTAEEKRPVDEERKPTAEESKPAGQERRPAAAESAPRAEPNHDVAAQRGPAPAARRAAPEVKRPEAK